MKAVLLAVPLMLLALPHACRGAEPPPQAAQGPDGPFRTLLTQHCRECHSGEKPKGDFSLDKLAPDFDNAANRDRWLAVQKRVQAGEMPPKAKPRPAEKDVRWRFLRARAQATTRAALTLGLSDGLLLVLFGHGITLVWKSGRAASPETDT